MIFRVIRYRLYLIVGDAAGTPNRSGRNAVSVVGPPSLSDFAVDTGSQWLITATVMKPPAKADKTAVERFRIVIAITPLFSQWSSEGVLPAYHAPGISECDVRKRLLNAGLLISSPTFVPEMQVSRLRRASCRSI
jgi:hypothetical protein